MKGKKRKILLSIDEKKQLVTLSNKMNAPYKLVIRAKLILMSANGVAHKNIAKKFDIEPKIVTKWVKRWIDTESIEEIEVKTRLVDLERSGAPFTFTPEQKCKIIAIACEKPEVYKRPITHWSNKELAEEIIKQGIVDTISVTHIGYILRKNDIKPHKIKYWLNGKPDEKKNEKIKDICNLYINAPELSKRDEVVINVDEMTGIQALERIFPDKPVLPGKCARIEFEYKRNGTQTLIAGRNVVSGKVKAVCKQTRNERDFLDFIKLIEKENPQAKKIHIVSDNLNTHISESLVKYIAKINNFTEDLGKKGKNGILKSMKTREKFLTNLNHRIAFHYTPKHASWMNQIEIWFGILNSKVIKRGSFISIADLKKKILEFIRYYNKKMAKSFKWTYTGQVLEGH